MRVEFINPGSVDCYFDSISRSFHRYIIMGRHKMEVWYQSPYPDDAARLPKLYLCEFCLQYQKCEIGMKRHAAKCVWRHPPGDEVCRTQFKNSSLNQISNFFFFEKFPFFTDLSKGKIGCLASGWKAAEAVLSTFMFASEILSRS